MIKIKCNLCGYSIYSYSNYNYSTYTFDNNIYTCQKCAGLPESQNDRIERKLDQILDKLKEIY